MGDRCLVLTARIWVGHSKRLFFLVSIFSDSTVAIFSIA